AEFGTAGRGIYPPGRPRGGGGSRGAPAVAAPPNGAPGTPVRGTGGRKEPVPHPPLGAGARDAGGFALPWRAVTAESEQQRGAPGGIVVLGIIVATIAGVLLSAYLTRPLQVLADGAIRIARGDRPPAAAPPPAGTEEISTLLGAFEQM